MRHESQLYYRWLIRKTCGKDDYVGICSRKKKCDGLNLVCLESMIHQASQMADQLGATCDD